jgi:hypothetical protein
MMRIHPGKFAVLTTETVLLIEMGMALIALEQLAVTATA